MLFIQVEGPDTLLKSEQRFVDFCTINLGLLICVHGVGTSFATCQVDKANLTVQSSSVLQLHLHNSVGAGTFGVRACGTTSSETHSDL